MQIPPIHSEHIFIFPFKWEKYVGPDASRTPLSLRASVDEFAMYLERGPWRQFTFEPVVNDEQYNTYNEFAYFYDFARDVLNISMSDPETSVRIAQFKYEAIEIPKASYEIHLINGSTYTLKLKEILLNIYENGVGIIAYLLQNNTYPALCDIRKINDYGRRLFPQFLGHEQNNQTQDPKKNFLASKIILNGVKTAQTNTIVEDFSHFDAQEKVKRFPSHLPNHIMALLGTGVKDHPALAQKGDYLIAPLLDDRMFVMCFSAQAAHMKHLLAKPADKPAEDKEANWTSDTEWYQYLFIDGGSSSCPNPEMRKRLIEKATYTRWLNTEEPAYSTLFGITRYSFMMMVSDSSDTFVRNVLLNHFRHMYFQLVLLCLLQRASIIQFSGEVARIARRLTGDAQEIDGEQSNIAHLYVQYIKFVNRIFFREVTPQEQGIELYDLLQEQMRIRDEVKDLREEIAEINTYAETKENSRLTYVATLFLPASFVASLLALFGLNWPEEVRGQLVLYLIISSVVLAFISLFLAKPLVRIIKQWGKR